MIAKKRTIESIPTISVRSSLQWPFSNRKSATRQRAPASGLKRNAAIMRRRFIQRQITPRFSGRPTANQVFKLTDERAADPGPLQALARPPDAYRRTKLPQRLATIFKFLEQVEREAIRAPVQRFVMPPACRFQPFVSFASQSTREVRKYILQ